MRELIQGFRYEQPVLIGARDTYSSVLKRPLSAKEDIASIPAQWLREDLSSSASTNPSPDDNPFTIATHLTAPARDPRVNRYGVPAGQGLKEWEKSGWIWAGDPRGCTCPARCRGLICMTDC